MTDKDFICVLRGCSTNECNPECPFGNLFFEECTTELATHSLDIINRQQAEIERLTTGIERLADESDARDIDEYNMVCRVRAEAIKEFAERLKRVVAVHNGDMWSKYEYIDNLVKEMVGE